MSLIRATNSSMPNLVGLSLLVGGGASALSVMVGGAPILNFPGREVADFAFGAAASVTGFFVLKEGSAVAAWLAGFLVVGAMVYAGLSIDADQAGRMTKAAINAAKTGATTATDSVANGTPISQYRAIRQLHPAENAECEEVAVLEASVEDTGKGVTLPKRLEWTQSKQGKLNCSIASDGKRWVWSAN